MATARKVASTRLQAIQAEALAEQKRTPAKPLASYFSASGKAARRPRAGAKPGV